MRFLPVLLLLISSANADEPKREGSDWPRFLGPTDNGLSPEKGLLESWPDEGLPKLWECELGAGYGPVAIVDQKLFHFDHFGDTARLTCRNAVTGKFIWKFEYPCEYQDQYGYDAGPRSGPVVDGEFVYIHGVTGMVHCVDVETGKKVWEVDTVETYNIIPNFFGIGDSPVVFEDLLLVAVGGSAKEERAFRVIDIKGNGTAIVAFDKRTGKEQYRIGNETAGYSSPIVVRMHGQAVGLYFARGGLLGFNPKTGAELFHFAYRSRINESVNAANPVVVGNRVFLTECYELGSTLLEIDSKWNVKKVWSDTDEEQLEVAMQSHWCTPIAVDGYVYGCHGRSSNGAELRCVELATGKVMWKEPGVTRCTLAFVDGKLISWGEYGELRVFKPNAKKYDEFAIWQVPGFDAYCWAPPAISRGRLYLRGQPRDQREGHRLACYEMKK